MSEPGKEQARQFFLELLNRFTLGRSIVRPNLRVLLSQKRMRESTGLTSALRCAASNKIFLNNHPGQQKKISLSIVPW